MAQDRAEGTPATSGRDEGLMEYCDGRCAGYRPVPHKCDPPAGEVDLADRLAPFLVRGSLGTSDMTGRTYATPQALAVMFADLAARLVTVEIPEGGQLSLAFGLQPAAPMRVPMSDRQDADMRIIDAFAAALGAEAPSRHLLSGGGVQYRFDMVTPPGLTVSSYMSVEPNAEEAEVFATIDRRRAERRDPGEVSGKEATA